MSSAAVAAMNHVPTGLRKVASQAGAEKVWKGDASGVWRIKMAPGATITNRDLAAVGYEIEGVRMCPRGSTNVRVEEVDR